MLYSWHEGNWKQLTQQWENRPNAWLLTGKAKTGELAFAGHLAQALLCEEPQDEFMPCGECLACRLFKEGQHPDYRLLSPEQIDDEPIGGRKLQQIKIDAVREVIQFTQLSSHRGGLRVIVIFPAECLNIQAANALLKVLEEPPVGVVFILVSTQRDRLLATIKSRCRSFVLNSPTNKEALQYLAQQEIPDASSLLAFYGGAPLFDVLPEQDEMRSQLLTILAEPSLIAYLDFAAKFDQKKWALSVFLDWMQKWLIDLVWVRHHEQAYFYPTHTEILKKKGQNIHLIVLFDYLRLLRQLAPYGQHTLNVKLQVESIFIDYLELIKS